ncbi:hypothetical protein [Actinotalea fermentans]|uniref:hypothetical protein n=1 Tax=Actinotalea fermentans TaxID=43671 RepID=UPI00051F4AB9|nr:hypothetical protein N867_18045 [Actinotalea fermentans ATCC 43279 = JCM 9966 = DSM 3133]
MAAGARVIALELHPGRAATLRERFTDAGVVVVQADARDLLLPRRRASTAWCSRCAGEVPAEGCGGAVQAHGPRALPHGRST